jgi:hypothetical protein
MSIVVTKSRFCLALTWLILSAHVRCTVSLFEDKIRLSGISLIHIIRMNLLKKLECLDVSIAICI